MPITRDEVAHLARLARLALATTNSTISPPSSM
jgi:Asp-tRNA(Asn)/Glu-tRNA(Gln) amidotransferase C subunit